jgi:gluconokinase
VNDAILGLDIGTTSTKGVLFDLSGSSLSGHSSSGAELAVAEQAYRLHTPQPGWAEQDPEEVWQALLHVLRTIASRTDVGAPTCGRPLALALAAQSGSLLPARKDGTPVSPIITWLDGRTEALVKSWRAEGIEAKVRAISGCACPPSPGCATTSRTSLLAPGTIFLSTITWSTA